jgi:hypothetical protein
MVFGYLEGVPLFFKELLCNLSILELCSTLTFCTWCVLLLFYDIFHTKPNRREEEIFKLENK